ncbi:Protein of unknown function [Rhodococcoides kroppenstedtii]|uniref:DUF2637 domain-containing protein n=1 Tax=Rhodococcoides kroppenstedtii TaxID=293050 RepID=A0A1I0U9H0_9NOCA|nr:DUF2637 domain-containing protein [Rhodococcus kroppenstedtii]SFA60732.1 Protein of unknown function [Rhodococcus kroppenstedtii]
MLLARLTSLAILTVVATLAFVLSFTALADLAARNAVPKHQAWMVPVVVDATIVAATLAVVTLRHRRWYAWSLLALAATLSVAGNVAHAWSAGVVAVVVAAVPPLFVPPGHDRAGGAPGPRPTAAYTGDAATSPRRPPGRTRPRRLLAGKERTAPRSGGVTRWETRTLESTGLVGIPA